MNKILLALLLTSVAVNVSHAQGQTVRPGSQASSAAAAAAVTVDQVIDNYLRAIGGVAAFDKVLTRVRKGWVEIEGLPGKGTVEEYLKAPDKMMAKMNLPAIGVMQYAYDGKSGWKSDAATGLVDVQGSELESFALDSRIDGEVKLRQRYAKLELKGVQQVNGRDAYVVIGTPTGQKAEKLYFDKQSGLLVRLDATRASAGGDTSVETYMDDYREIEGVKIPSTERLKSMGLTFTFKYDTVQLNLPLDDALFKRPRAK